MSQGRSGGARPVWARVGTLAVLLVVCPWAARGQYVPPQDDAAWRQSAEEGRGATGDGQRRPQTRDDVLRQQAAMDVVFNETNGPQIRRTSQLVAWYGAAAIGLGLLAVLSLVTRAYLRLSATTDPEKLALTDPWVRANLDQLKAVKDPGGQEAP
jgi:hypothetical protein